MIGNADDFWRLRLTRVDTQDVDFEWHDDILYREPNVDFGSDSVFWHVEAVRLDDPDTVVRIRTFVSETEANEFLRVAQEDLVDLTKSRFELAYFDESASAE
jgi:hypothetical protein